MCPKSLTKAKPLCVFYIENMQVHLILYVTSQPTYTTHVKGYGCGFVFWDENPSLALFHQSTHSKQTLIWLSQQDTELQVFWWQLCEISFSWKSPLPLPPGSCSRCWWPLLFHRLTAPLDPSTLFVQDLNLWITRGKNDTCGPLKKKCVKGYFTKLFY